MKDKPEFGLGTQVYHAVDGKYLDKINSVSFCDKMPDNYLCLDRGFSVHPSFVKTKAGALTIPSCKVIYARSCYEIEQGVMRLIKQGYRTSGNLVVYETDFYQSMYKDECLT